MKNLIAEVNLLTPNRFLFCVFILLSVGNFVFAQDILPIIRHEGEKVWETQTSPSDIGYNHVANWLKLPADFAKLKPSDICIDSKGNIYILDRGVDAVPSIICVNEAGEFLFQWKEAAFGLPHFIHCDKDDNFWVSDTKNHQLYKLNQSGEIVFTIGEKGVPGNDKTHFNKPTDIDFLDDDSHLISDGYGNQRVMKLNTNFEYMEEWGVKGTNPGEFVLPHALTLGSDNRIYVADRDAWRVQIFNKQGKVLEVWPHIGRIFDLAETPDKHFVCLDGETGRITKVNNKGDVIGFIGNGDLLVGAHGMAVTADGSIIVALTTGKVEKFKKIIKE